MEPFFVNCAVLILVIVCRLYAVIIVTLCCYLLKPLLLVLFVDNVVVGLRVKKNMRWGWVGFVWCWIGPNFMLM